MGPVLSLFLTLNFSLISASLCTTELRILSDSNFGHGQEITDAEFLEAYKKIIEHLPAEDLKRKLAAGDPFLRSEGLPLELVMFDTEGVQRLKDLATEVSMPRFLEALKQEDSRREALELRLNKIEESVGQTFDQSWEFHHFPRPTTVFEFSPNSDLAVVGIDDNRGRRTLLWHLEKGLIKELPETTDLKFTRDGQHIVQSEYVGPTSRITSHSVYHSASGVKKKHFNRDILRLFNSAKSARWPISRSRIRSRASCTSSARKTARRCRGWPSSAVTRIPRRMAPSPAWRTV